MTVPLQATRHYPTLDGLRGVAAIAVVVLHISGLFGLKFAPVHAHLAVDFFFLLSGFVIAHAYDSRLAQGLGVLRFVRLRVVRLYPTLIVGVAIGTVLLLGRWWVDRDVALGSIARAGIANLLLCPTNALLYFRPYAFPVDSPLWSLSLEMGVNILYAVAFAGLTRLRLWGIVALSAAALVATALPNAGLDVGWRWDELPLGAPRVGFAFTLGVLMARTLAEYERTSLLGLAVAPLLALTLMAPVGHSALYELAAVGVVFPAVVLGGAFAPRIRRLDWVWGGLGEISYPLYVVHYPLVGLASNVAHAKHLQGPALAAAVIACAVGVGAAAIFTLVVIDKPLRRALGGARAGVSPRPSLA